MILAKSQSTVGEVTFGGANGIQDSPAKEGAMEFAHMVFSQMWQVTALILFVLVTARFVARNRPHLAYVLWLVVLVKCVTPPLWTSPSGVFSWLQTAMAREAPQEPERAVANSQRSHANSLDADGIDAKMLQVPVDELDVEIHTSAPVGGAMDYASQLVGNERSWGD